MLEFALRNYALLHYMTSWIYLTKTRKIDVKYVLNYKLFKYPMPINIPNEVGGI